MESNYTIYQRFTPATKSQYSDISLPTGYKMPRDRQYFDLQNID